MRKKTGRKKQGLFDSLERYNINKNRNIVPNSVDATLFFLIGILAFLFGDSALDVVRCDAAAIISAAAAATASLGSGIMMASKKRGTTRMMNVSKEMARFNNDLAISNWNRENEYNSPAAQMQRYREAGLNPNLIYGQQNTGGNIQTGQATTDAGELTKNSDRYAQALQGVSNAIGTYQNLMAQNAQINNTKAVTTATEADAELRRRQSEHQGMANKYFDSQMKYTLEGMAVSNAQNALNYEMDRQFKAQERLRSLDKMKKDIEYSSASTDEKRRQIEFYDDQSKKIGQDIKESQAREYSLKEGVKIAYGNLGVAAENAHSLARNASTNETRANIEQEKWLNMQPGVSSEAQRQHFENTGQFPAGSSWSEKAWMLFNHILNVGAQKVAPLANANTSAYKK